jgi:hypothetical protein
MATLNELREQASTRQAIHEAQRAVTMEQEEIKLRELLLENGLVLNEDVAAIFTRSGKIVAVKKPSRVAHKGFVNAANKDKLNADVIETYLKGVLFYPSQQELQVILDETPGLLGIAVNKANELISQSEVEISGN